MDAAAAKAAALAEEVRVHAAEGHRLERDLAEALSRLSVEEALRSEADKALHKVRPRCRPLSGPYLAPI